MEIEQTNELFGLMDRMDPEARLNLISRLTKNGVQNIPHEHVESSIKFAWDQGQYLNQPESISQAVNIAMKTGLIVLSEDAAKYCESNGQFLEAARILFLRPGETNSQELYTKAKDHTLLNSNRAEGKERINLRLQVMAIAYEMGDKTSLDSMFESYKIELKTSEEWNHALECAKEYELGKFTEKIYQNLIDILDNDEKYGEAELAANKMGNIEDALRFSLKQVECADNDNKRNKYTIAAIYAARLEKYDLAISLSKSGFLTATIYAIQGKQILAERTYKNALLEMQYPDKIIPPTVSGKSAAQECLEIEFEKRGLPVEYATAISQKYSHLENQKPSTPEELAKQKIKKELSEKVSAAIGGNRESAEILVAECDKQEMYLECARLCVYLEMTNGADDFFDKAAKQAKAQGNSTRFYETLIEYDYQKEANDLQRGEVMNCLEEYNNLEASLLATLYDLSDAKELSRQALEQEEDRYFEHPRIWSKPGFNDLSIIAKNAGCDDLSDLYLELKKKLF